MSPAAGAPALAGGGAGMPDNVQALLGNSEGGMMLPEEPGPDDHIDVAQIEGQVKKSSVRKVAALVEQHPDESMSILRTWMHEGE
jgi:flagellar M-ring protein FliF